MIAASVHTTVVIVNWNTRQLLADCLESLFADAPALPVVVVDNASTDDSMAVLPARYPQVTWLPQARNLGFAAGNNLALRRVTTEFAWLLNPDTRVRPGALAALERCLDEHAEAAVVGAALWNPDGSPQACAFRFPTVATTVAEFLRLPRPLARLRDRIFQLQPLRAAGPVPWVLGASMLVRMSAVRHVGMLREDYFMYAEELDWCRRFWQAGWQVHLSLAADVVHLGGGSTQQVREPMLKELFRSRGQYLAAFSQPGRWALFPWAIAAVARWNAALERLKPQPGWRPALFGELAQSATAGWLRACAGQPDYPGAEAPAPGVSAVIITRNEARKLPGCLESLRRASAVKQIVVVDDVSTDDTVALARQGADVVVEHPHTGENWDLNKNVGMALATEPWVLLIDADERLTPEAAAVLDQALRGDLTEAGFWLPREEWYFGRWARHASSDARVLRLFRRGAATFLGDRLHAHPVVQGRIGYLPAPLRHEAYDTLGAYIAKTRAYTDHEARVRWNSGERARLNEVVVASFRHIWYRWVRLQGYRDGWFGFYYVLVTALYPGLERLKLWNLGRRL